MMDSVINSYLKNELEVGYIVSGMMFIHTYRFAIEASSSHSHKIMI